MPVLGQEYLPESSLPQFLPNIVLLKTILRIEVLSSRRVNRRLIFYEMDVVFEILGALRVEQPDLLILEQFAQF